MKKITKLSLLSLLILAGCSPDNGETTLRQCPPSSDAQAVLGYVQVRTCNVDDCVLGNYSEVFATGICPVEYPNCLSDGAVYYCSNLNCEPGQHSYNGKCEEDSVEHCGLHSQNCTTAVEGWGNGDCVHGTCVVAECTLDYALKDGVCVERDESCGVDAHIYQGFCEDDSINHCGEHGVVCSELEGWSSGNCVNGKCFADLCIEGYESNEGVCQKKMVHCDIAQHRYMGECEDDSIEHCGDHSIDCAAMEGWNSGTCDDAVCVVESCVEPYEPDGRKCRIKSDVCEDNQHYENGACVADSVQSCGENAVDCTQSVTGWNAGECVDGMCVVSSCLDKYDLVDDFCRIKDDACPENTHLVGNECIEDSVAVCGNRLKNCTLLDGWESGKCVSGDCAAETCVAPYEVQNGVCTIPETVCAAGTHYYLGVCEEDSLQNCGYHGEDCTRYEGWNSGTCVSGRCVVEKCEPGYEVVPGGDFCEVSNCAVGVYQHYTSDGICEDDSIENCGAQGNNCAQVDGWVTGNCVMGRCVPKVCARGYVLNEETSVCEVRTSCPEGANQHLFDGECEDNTLDNCGSHGNRCADQEGWNTGVCNLGTCEIQSCRDIYVLNQGTCSLRTSCPEHQHLYNYLCEDNSLDNCGTHGNQCTSIAGWAAGSCTNGTCSVSSCASGYCMNGGVCTDGRSNPKACGTSGNCTVCGANQNCVNGQCITTNCPAGQHIFNNSCEVDSPSNCGAHGALCNISYSTGVACQGGACILTGCNTGFHTYNNTCEQDTPSHCGSHTNVCQFSNGAGVCSNGQCIYTGCNSGFHVFNNTCESDTVANCGAHGVVCQIANGYGTCPTGTCTFSGCNAGFHTYVNTCEQNTNTNCGVHGNACPANSTCYGTNCVCNGGYHTYNGGCEIDDKTNCGTHDNACPSYSSCAGGTCVCQSGRHMYNGKCETDTTSNCGAHGNKCGSLSHGSYSCPTGTCNPKCNSGYHLYNGTCEKNDSTNCGWHGHVCTTGEVPLSTSVTCSTAGECEAVSCVTHAATGCECNKTNGMCLCNSGYHIYGNTCEKNDVTNCGTHAAACNTTTKPNSTKVSCASAGVCKATACATGYKLSSGNCVLK